MGTTETGMLVRLEIAGYSLPDQHLRKILGVETCGLHLEQFIRQDYLDEQIYTGPRMQIVREPWKLFDKAISI